MVHYPSAAEITAPNAEDESGGYWDPWEALGLRCCSYNSEIDQNAIDVLRGIRDKLYNTDIAERAGLPPQYVELLQSIFCGKNWAEYGTSPRACFPMADDFPDLIAAWEAYYERQWGEPASGTLARAGGDAPQSAAPSSTSGPTAESGDAQPNSEDNS